jgi:hypothetical protein
LSSASLFPSFGFLAGDERVVLTEAVVNPCPFFNIALILFSYLIIVLVDDREADIRGSPLATSANTYAY